jgi:hypothetical protein
MATRTIYSIVKGVTPDRAKALIAEAMKSLPGPAPKESKWSDWPYIVKQRQVTALACRDALVISHDAWRLAEAIAIQLDAPHLELRVQESDHWDFTLYRQAQVVADFSTRVSYYDANPATPRPWKQGHARAFADLWNVPLERVVPYLVDWGSLPVSRFAVDGDEFSTDDWCQIFDFMRVLGVENPFDHPDRFEFEIPAWQSTYARQPLWRRVVRELSVWVKGTYPDVPRPTPEQRALMKRRVLTVRITRV